MKYIELTVRTTSEASELVCDILWNYTEGGVAVSDTADVIALQSGKSGVYWDYLDDSLKSRGTEALVKAFLPLARAGDVGAAMQEIYACRNRAEGAIDFGSLEESTREIEGDDWIEIWKKHFRPIPFGRVTVVPEWIPYEKREKEEVVLLDSNMAFGTGEHETTAMCIGFLQDTVKGGEIVLDVGCGSGILGIAAAKLGAGHCYLTDIDPIAVASARHNAEKNGVRELVTVTETDLVQNAAVSADIVVANITAEVLVRLAPAVPQCLKAGGALILSGIIESRLALVEEAFKGVGFQLKERRRQGDWYALLLTR